MEYYSAIKRNEIELFVVRWIDLESAIQSEVSQKEKKIDSLKKKEREKQIPYGNTYIWNLKKQKENGSDEPSCRTGIKTQT